MKILFLSSVLPHARVIGGSIVVYNRIRFLAERGHEIGLASFLNPGEESLLADFRPIMAELETVPMPRRSSWQRLTGKFFGPPPPFQPYRSEEMMRLVGAMVERSRYDVTVAEFSVMGQFLHRNPFLPATRRVISVHGCLTTAYQKTIEMNPGSRQSLARRLWLRRLQAYEFGMYRGADLVLALTREERMTLLKYEPKLRTNVVPYGVDVDRYRPRPDGESDEAIVFTGVYTDEPNRDAVLWFVRQAWPAIREKHPEVTFRVVGRAPTPAMLELARRDPRIVVTGEVADMAPVLARARVYVCPMRLGTGFHGKILQAMASGVPVVSTTTAAQGIPAQTGQNILLADTPHVMVECLDMLLANPDLRETIARNARELVVRRFAWQRCADELESILTETVQ